MTTYTLHPVQFEIIDDADDLAAKITMFDSGAATIEIKTLVDCAAFDALVPHIQNALAQMQFEGDK